MQKRLRQLLLTAAVLLIVRDLAEAQPLTYTLLPAPGASPSARFDGTIAYDPAARQLYMFGGQDAAVSKNDLWTYSLAERRWVELIPAGQKPPMRFGHTLLHDPVRGRLIVFGGQAAGFFNDVWAYDIARNTWAQIGRDDAGPSRRYGHSAIYEPSRDRMIVSHGFTDAGRFDDTWAFDFTTATWRDISPSGTRPLRRCLHHASFDAASNQMYLYGGCASGFGPCPLGDLWTLDLTTNTWTEKTTAFSPPAREHYGMAFHSARNRLVIYGGRGAGILNDTWEYNPQARVWQQVFPEGVVPSPRQRQEAVYAPDRGVILFFGGATSSGMSNELWMLGPAFVSSGPQVSSNGIVNAFSGSTGVVSPGEIVSIFGTGLGPSPGIAFGFDAQSALLPTSGPGVNVTVNGIPAPLYFAREDQVNVQIPYELAGAIDAQFIITVNGQASVPVTVPLARTHPGLVPQVWNSDGTVNSAQNAAVAGGIIVLYATGHGATNPPSRTGAKAAGPSYASPVAGVSVRIAGMESDLLFSGQAPGTAGVMQLNVRVPAAVESRTAVPVLVTLGAEESRAVATVWIR